MSIAFIRTADGRLIALPRADALWVLRSADALDSVLWWHSASGANAQPQPLFMPRARYGIGLGWVQ